MSSLPRQARGEGFAETVGEVQLTAAGAGTIPAGSTIRITYPTAITNRPGAGNVTCLIGGAPRSCPGNFSVSVSGSTVTLGFGSSTQFAAGDGFIIFGVRLNVSTLGGTNVTATLSGTSSSPATNPITFNNPSASVGTLSRPSLSAPTPLSGSATNCNLTPTPSGSTFPLGPGQTMTVNGRAAPQLGVAVAENFAAALTTAADETAFTPSDSISSGAQVQMVLSGVPSNVTIWAPQAVTGGGLTLSLPDGGASSTTASRFDPSNGAVAITYAVTGDSVTSLESVTVPLSVTGAQPVATGTVSASLILAPVGTNSIVSFAANASPVGGGFSIDACTVTVGASPTSLSFRALLGTSNPPTQNLQLTASNGGTVQWTATVATSSGGSWLSISPVSGNTPGSATVSVNISGLATGTYNGTVTIGAPSGTFVTVPVTLTVVGLTTSPVVLAFSAQASGANPPAHTLRVTSSDGSAISFTAQASSSGGNWLSVSPSFASTPANLSASVNVAGLAAGTYSGVITISPSGGGGGPSLTVSVTLSLGALTLNLSPAALSFTTQTGGANPPAQTVQVASSTGAAISFTAQASSSGGNWLSVTPASGTTPATLTVSVNAGGLAAGTYQGQVTVQSQQATPSTQTVTVTLAVEAPAALSVQPASLSFQVQAGAGNPPPLTLFISNAGGAALNWSAQVSLLGGGAWLTLSPSSGSTPAIISAVVNVTGLAPGNYSGVVTVQAPQASPGTQTVPVTLAITAQAPLQLSAQPTSLAFRSLAGAGNPPPQTVVISNSGGSALAWNAQAITQNGGAWLSVSPATGFTPGVTAVSVNAAGLGAGTYQGSVIVQAPQAGTGAQIVSVRLEVEAAGAPELDVDPSSLTFETALGAGNPPAQALRISNTGSGTLNWTATPATASGGNWLVLTPSSGSAAVASLAVVQIIANVAGLAPGTYSGSVRVDSPTTGKTKTVAVTLVISQAGPSLLVSQSGLSFTGVEGGAALPSQNFGVLNAGSGVMNWTVGTSGASWLRVSAGSGTSSGNSLQIPLVDVSVNVSGLAAGQSSTLLRVDAPGANNTPQFVAVALTVLPAGSNPGVLARPAGLIFTAPAGGSSSAPRSVSLATASSGTVQARVVPGTFDGANWLDAAPRNVTISPANPATIAVQTTPGTLAPGIYRGAVTFLFSDGSPPQVVSILFSVVPSSASALALQVPAAAAAPQEQPADLVIAPACVPNQLFLADRKLGLNFLAQVGSPAGIEVELKDNCGNSVPSAPNQPLPDVRAIFSNGDLSVPMVHVGNGIYQGTWKPLNALNQVVVKVRADAPSLGSAQMQVSGTLADNPKAALLSAGGIVSAASFAPGAPLAPGAIVAAFGRNLVFGINSAPRLPLDTTLGGASFNVAGVSLPLFFASPTQINAQLPFDLAPNSRPQAVVRTRSATTGLDVVTVPETITIAPVAPAIFTTNSSGTGQGAILIAGTATVAGPAGSVSGQDARPVKRGEEFIAIFSTGLGDVTNRPAPGAAASNNPLSETLLKPSVTIGGVPADVNFAGLAPFFAGLYQVNAKVPVDAPTGDAVPVILSIGGVSSNTATIAVE